MALRDPFAAYNAGSNVEAHLVSGLLQDAGIQAVVIEDVSQVGVWMGGTISELHKPQVWVERADIERARPVLEEYDRRSAERSLAKLDGDGSPIEVECEKCGKRSEFPASQLGSVQNCPHCLAYVDVGDEVGFEGWDETPEDEGE
jgi:hypothetical protein